MLAGGIVTFGRGLPVPKADPIHHLSKGAMSVLPSILLQKSFTEGVENSESRRRDLRVEI
jgi:hypothetical protein